MVAAAVVVNVVALRVVAVVAAAAALVVVVVVVVGVVGVVVVGAGAAAVLAVEVVLLVVTVEVIMFYGLNRSLIPTYSLYLRALYFRLLTIASFALLAVDISALCVAGCGQLRALCCWLLQIAWSSGVGPKGQVWTTYCRLGHDWYFGIILAAAMETGSSFSLTPADAGFGFVRERERERERERSL